MSATAPKVTERHTLKDGFHHVKFEQWSSSPILQEYFHLRKKVFVDELGWSLKVGPDGEFDQYDRIGVDYILSVQKGQLLGGMRVAPTTTRFTHDWKEHSYMIRDSYNGVLDGMDPEMVFDAPPVDPRIWEMTRVIAPGEPKHFKALMDISCKFLKLRGASHYLFHTRPVVERLGRMWNFDITPIGPRQEICGQKYQTFKVAVKRLNETSPTEASSRLTRRKEAAGLLVDA